MALSLESDITPRRHVLSFMSRHLSVCYEHRLCRIQVMEYAVITTARHGSMALIGRLRAATSVVGVVWMRLQAVLKHEGFDYSTAVSLDATMVLEKPDSSGRGVAMHVLARRYVGKQRRGIGT